MYRSAYTYSDEIIFYFDFVGNKYVASGGSLAWRINNPGLVRSHSHFSRRHGSIGSCGRYAIFARPDDGRKALSAWVHSKKYYDSTLKVIAEHYSPNAPNAFLNQLCSLAKISPTTKVKLLTKHELNRLLASIEKLCGYGSIGNEKLSLLPKIIAKIEHVKSQEDSFLIADNVVLSKTEAIQWILSHRLDAVIIHEQNNKTHLRSRPHHGFQKINVPAKGLLPSVLNGREIETLVRVIGEKRSGQCIWGFINGIDNTKEEALASATLISQSSKGERVLSMPNDTIWKGIDLLVCGVLKVSIDTPLVTWTVKFLRHLLALAEFEIEPTSVIVFAHSQGAIYIEHALELLSPQESQHLRIFTFGGGSFIEPEKAHPDSHNYASAADYVCRLASPNLQCLALKRYYGLKSGLNEEQVIHQLAYEDAILSLDSIDPKTIEMYTESRKKIYEKEFSQIKHITILDPDPGTNWKHEFGSECYQATVQNIVRKYQK